MSNLPHQMTHWCIARGSGWMLLLLLNMFVASTGFASMLSPEQLAERIEPPYKLGQQENDQGVWSIVNLDGALAGYVFETEPLAAIPGFSGQPVNMLVTMSNEGKLINVEILHHNEPIFVSGLGQAPFHEFVTQYRGLSINNAFSVGVPYGKVEGASSQIYLDGVTKATASVRIAHESILAAAYAVAREKMRGLGSAPAPAPDPAYSENLSFEDLVTEGIARHHVVLNREVEALFEGTDWESDDPESELEPEAPYLDLWVIDIGPRSIARAVLDEEGLEKLDYFLSISPDSEPILLIEQARHGLVSEAFVRNTEPDLLGATQDGLPIVLRDADLELSLKPGLPSGNQLVVRTDRRLGFDPTREWQLSLKVVRKHGSFMPTLGTVDLQVDHVNPERFYLAPVIDKPLSPVEQAVLSRKSDLVVLGVFLGALFLGMLVFMDRLASLRYFTILRLSVLGAVVGFIGWWGQGQLSIATVLGTLRAGIENQQFSFLLYDPFSLLIWGVVVVSFFIWGRGLFCGWLCPYGAMQEFSAAIGKRLGLTQIKVSRRWDGRLKKLKYMVLLALVGMTVFMPTALDVAIEVEPFKTAVTTYFVREWYFVLYAVLWLVLGMFLYKSFCRYLCPLGAFMALGGLFRTRKWIERRKECGSPCQLCAVRCQYKAIKPSGEIAYDECFQCLDCVTIYQDKNTCVPLVLEQKRRLRCA